MKDRWPRAWHSVATHMLLPFHFPPLYLPKHLQPSEGKRNELKFCLVAMGTSCFTEKEWRVAGPTMAYWPLTHVSKTCLDIEVLRKIFAYLKYRICSKSASLSFITLVFSCRMPSLLQMRTVKSVAPDQSQLLKVVRAVVPGLCGTRDWFHGK